MTNQAVDENPRIRLTTFSHGAGCACKLGPGELSQVLSHLPGVVDKRVLVDAATRDDAAVFRLSADRALVATVDFFTPIVDDAKQWGAIAAANALSDVYAMGGTPLFGLNLLGWPREKLPFELLGEVIKGAAEVCETRRLRRRRRTLDRFAGAALRHGRDGRGPPRPHADERRGLRRRRTGPHQAPGHRGDHHRAQAGSDARIGDGRRGALDDRAQRRRGPGGAPGGRQRGHRRDRLRAAAASGQHPRRRAKSRRKCPSKHCRSCPTR